jgi:hypothetical protein
MRCDVRFGFGLDGVELGERSGGGFEDRLVVGDRAHARLDGARGGDHRLERAIPQDPARAIGGAEHRLHAMRDVDDRLDAYHRAEALDGVQEPHQLAELARGGPAGTIGGVDGQQAGVDRAEVLVDLGEVGRAELAQVDLHGLTRPAEQRLHFAEDDGGRERLRHVARRTGGEDLRS